ncbi:MAG: hypothetical protein ACFCVC_02640 [Acidimicrobiia bacterium]
MGSDDHVIVLGGDDLAPPDPVPPRRPLVVLLLLVVALLVGVIAFVLSPRTGTPTVADPTGLEAPPEPPRAFVESTAVTAPADVPELALGWRPVTMAGPGWSVSDIAHGPAGWLAVSAGSPVIVHTSTNAVLWEAASLVEVAGSDPQVAVGEGVMALAAVGDLDNAVFAAISGDGGETWVETLVDRRPAVVHGVAVVGSVVYAFGEVLEPTDPTWGEGTPVVWRHDHQGWVVMEDLAAGGGAVTGVLQSGDGPVRAFGQIDGLAASWVVGDELEPVPVEVPPGLGWFVEVGPDGGVGYFAVAGTSVTGVGTSVWWSEDLVSWEAPGSGRPLREAIVHAGRVLAIHGDQVGLVSVGLDAQSFISNRYPGAETGWEEFGYVAALATDGETMVLGGIDDAGRPAIAVRGTTVQPTSLPVVADFIWSVVAGTEAAFPDPHNPPVIVTSGDRTFVLASGQVLEVEGLDSASPTIEPAVIGGDPIRAGRLGRVGDVVWAFDGDRRQLFTLDAGGGWAVSAMPLSWVDIVFDDGSGLVALGWLDVDIELARTRPDGSWMIDEVVEGKVWPAAAIDGAVFGVSEDGSGVDTAVVSTDGVEWQPVGIDGSSNWPLGGIGGILFLRDASDPFAVWLLDRWPEVERVVLPTHSPRTIQRFEDQLWVLSPGALWIRCADSSWEELPTGIQHGVTAPPAVIPGDRPTLVASFGDGVQLLRLSE